METNGTGDAAHELSGAHVGFDVVDPNGERVGTVRQISLARTCLVVELGGSVLRRKHRRPVHVSVVEDIDADAFVIRVAVTRAEVDDAPEFRELDDDCHAAIERYYDALASGGAMGADAHQGGVAP